MFKQGEKIHLHDGTIFPVPEDGLPSHIPGRLEGAAIRGFIRGALIDCDTGEERVGDWHENVITQYGHGMVVKNFIGHAEGTHASFWGIGRMTATGTMANTSNYSTMSAMDGTEYGYASNGGVSRVTVSDQQQTLSGVWSLIQTFSYASSRLTADAAVNCIAQYCNSSVGAGSALSFGTFAQQTKGNNQVLSVTYNWVFST